ncbi:hypothetical protein LR48_Vigan08g139600 [Vigna angularis]|uniref:Uncharacterized protein n=1 Tax=Phaseolus angularis TaxID=3914 RepID=A0A0L9V7C1_PHAAN|nr:hypothetical protein LR48_Vigan08g139600 [Vigna angularis]
MVGLPTLKCFNHHETTILTFIMGTTLRRGRERLREGFVNSGEFLGSSAEGESCWKNLEESKLAADLGEVRQRSSGVAAASLRKVDSSEVLGAASSEFSPGRPCRAQARVALETPHPVCRARARDAAERVRPCKLSVRPAVVIVSVRPRSYNRAFVRGVRPSIGVSVRPKYQS